MATAKTDKTARSIAPTELDHGSADQVAAGASRPARIDLLTSSLIPRWRPEAVATTGSVRHEVDVASLASRLASSA